METIYIPIGCGCASATLLRMKNLDGKSLPFDWMLSHLRFVNDITTSIISDRKRGTHEALDLFIGQQQTNTYSTYVNEDNLSSRYTDDNGYTHQQKFEFYRTISKSEGLSKGLPLFFYNEKYQTTYPHDLIEIDVEKYRRRLKRLSDLIFDQTKFLSFLYISPSSKETHYCIDNAPLTVNAGVQLNGFCDILSSVRRDFEVIFVDALSENDSLNEIIRKIAVHPRKNWYPMITENDISFDRFSSAEVGFSQLKVSSALNISTANLLNEAMGYHQRSALNDAESAYLNVIDIDPGNFAAIHMLGVVRFQLGDFLQAEQLLLRAAAMSIEIPELHYNLGNVYVSQGRTLDARTSFSRALAIKTDYMPALEQLAVIDGMSARTVVDKSKFHGDLLLDEFIAGCFDKDYKGVMLDIGAYDPVVSNNSYHFEMNGWDCYCFEPNPVMSAKLSAVRRHVVPIALSDIDSVGCDFIVVHHPLHGMAFGTGFHSDINRTDAVSEVIKVDKLRLDTWLDQNQQVRNIDVISMDTEGHEVFILNGFDLKRWLPKVLIVENFEEDVARCANVRRILFDAGYKLVRRVEMNDCFVRSDSV
jgi:FkbM family methyltransferase